MNINNKLKQQKQQYLLITINQKDSYVFFNLLTSGVLLNKVESILPDHRERLFPPTETLSMFLSQVLNSDSSCQHIVNNSSVSRMVSCLTMLSAATGGYCRVRKRLPIEMIRTLTRFTGELIDQEQPLQWRWKNRRVRLIDGTTLTMPDTKSNQETYPQ